MIATVLIPLSEVKRKQLWQALCRIKHWSKYKRYGTVGDPIVLDDNEAFELGKASLKTSQRSKGSTKMHEERRNARSSGQSETKTNNNNTHNS